MSKHHNEKENTKKPKLPLLALVAVALIGLFFVFIILSNPGTGATQAKNLALQTAAGASNSGTQTLSFEGNLETMNVQVQIPCGGHTPLIVKEVSKLSGVTNVIATSWDEFKITFDSTKTTQEEILSASIFKQYPAKLK